LSRGHNLSRWIWIESRQSQKQFAGGGHKSGVGKIIVLVHQSGTATSQLEIENHFAAVPSGSPSCLPRKRPLVGRKSIGLSFGLAMKPSMRHE